ncbi:hypothetical protein ACFQ15_14980 [Sphingomonas hankookensis]|uniref:hypothetical protein n=1 Tax=Sphingomonas hankookensis TaxID=563996 RepID=UPI001F5921AC|nr:hypothetical protein [Sphingomonas hankookensis]
MPTSRLPRKDPRTVARDIPGVLDVLFPRLTGGLVSSLNGRMFTFEGIEPVPQALIEKSQLQNAMVFQLSVARAEELLRGDEFPDWDECLRTAAQRQRHHYDARIPDALELWDTEIAEHAARNLVAMLASVQAQRPGAVLEHAPLIPGLGWVASGNGDFALGATLIEIKHTDRNFGSGDLRQVLMYWLLKYARSIETQGDVWSEVLLLNPRRNAALLVDYEYLLRSASAHSNRVELVELLRSALSQEGDRR